LTMRSEPTATTPWLSVISNSGAVSTMLTKKFE
jgi:hypothetical protein